MSEARWAADPSGKHELRYWDGTAWTEHVSDGGKQSTDPLRKGGLAARKNERTKRAEPQPAPAGASVPTSAGTPDAGSRLVAKGVGGTLTADRDWVIIDRKGLVSVSAGLRGEKRLPMASITSVQFKTPKLTNGHIQFTVPGATEAKKGSRNALEDENSVMFRPSQQKDFEAIRDFVLERIAERGRPQAAQVVHHAAAPTLGAQLKELAELRDAGVLTEAEFEAQKSKLLG